MSELLPQILSSKGTCSFCSFVLEFFYPHCFFFLWFPLLTAFFHPESAPHSSVLWLRLLGTFARCMHLFANSSSFLTFVCRAPVSQSSCFSELLSSKRYFGDSLLLRAHDSHRSFFPEPLLLRAPASQSPCFSELLLLRTSASQSFCFSELLLFKAPAPYNSSLKYNT
jgi:hypothetical protein